MINLKINDTLVAVEEGTTILEASKKLNIDIPTLCYLKGINNNASCRMCLVEVKGKTSTGQNSTFRVGSESRFIVTQDVFYQNIFNVDSYAVVDLDNINLGISGYNRTCYLKNFFYSLNKSTPNLRIVFGRIDFSGPGYFKNSNIDTVPTTYWVFINGAPVSSAIKTSADATLENDIYTDSGILTRD